MDMDLVALQQPKSISAVLFEANPQPHRSLLCPAFGVPHHSTDCNPADPPPPCRTRSAPWSPSCAASLWPSPSWPSPPPPPSPRPKDALVVDLPGDVATMDPHLQWDTDSYSVYRNIFDNLVTRDTSGKIVPQVATAWRYTNDTTIVFDLRSDIIFHDGSKLTAG
jgi:hypothetical protein